MMQEDELFFIRIDDPVEFRKSLLVGVRDVLHSLQKYEDFKRIRTAKVEQIIELRRVTKEINVLLNRLKQDLPMVAHAKKEVQKHRSRKAKLAAAKGKPVSVVAGGKKAKAPGEVKELEAQLKDIEGKLKVLG